MSPELVPGGGVNGGDIVAEGTPETVAAAAGSFTGAYLRPLLERASVHPEEPSGVSKDSTPAKAGAQAAKRTRRRTSEVSSEHQPDLIAAK